MGIRLLMNGDLISDCILPENIRHKYEQDPNDPTRWRLKWPECIHHIQAKKQCPKSKRLTMLPWCQLLDKLISPITCDSCPKRELPHVEELAQETVGESEGSGISQE